MAGELVITGTASGNATLVGAWELRASSMDTTEWQARGGTYPGNIDAFAASQSDSATGYDPAPKMALITLGSTTNGQTIILDEGGEDVTIVLAMVTGGTSANAQTIGATIATNTVTLPTTGTVTSGQLMVLYN